MNTALFFTDNQIKMLEKAIVEYEERLYSSESEEWQKEINELIILLKLKGVEIRGENND